MNSIVDAERLEWRCTCAVQTLFGMYTALGGVHIKIRGHSGRALHYVVDVATQHYVRAHCSSCHAWSELKYERETGEISSRIYDGSKPAGVCGTCDAECAAVAADACAVAGPASAGRE